MWLSIHPSLSLILPCLALPCLASPPNHRHATIHNILFLPSYLPTSILYSKQYALPPIHTTQIQITYTYCTYTFKLCIHPLPNPPSPRRLQSKSLRTHTHQNPLHPGWWYTSNLSCPVTPCLSIHTSHTHMYVQYSTPHPPITNIDRPAEGEGAEPMVEIIPAFGVAQSAWKLYVLWSMYTCNAMLCYTRPSIPRGSLRDLV